MMLMLDYKCCCGHRWEDLTDDRVVAIPCPECGSATSPSPIQGYQATPERWGDSSTPVHQVGGVSYRRHDTYEKALAKKGYVVASPCEAERFLSRSIEEA